MAGKKKGGGGGSSTYIKPKVIATVKSYGSGAIPVTSIVGKPKTTVRKPAGKGPGKRKILAARRPV